MQTVDNVTMEQSFRGIWEEIAGNIRPHVSTDAFKRWFSEIELVQTDECMLTFQVPNTIHQLWIESNYLPLVQSATLAVLAGPREIKFRVADQDKVKALLPDPAPKPEELPAAKSSEKEVEGAAVHGMNPRNTFDTFVVGSNNQFAHAAGLAVAQSPAKTYNPLFIYGGGGLGKTHLMQAIGQHVTDRKKNFKVMYLSRDRFSNPSTHASHQNPPTHVPKRHLPTTPSP